MSTNTFLLEQYRLTKNFSYSNWMNAAQKCYRTYERQIRAMFGEIQETKHTYYSFLNSKSHEKTTERRCEQNGLAHLKFRYYVKDANGMFEPKDFYCRCLFPRDGKISMKWRDEYENLQYFILFIDGNTIGYIDNSLFKNYIKNIEFSDIWEKYKFLNMDDLVENGIAKVYEIFEEQYLLDENNTKIKFSQLNCKLSSKVLLQYDPKVQKKYVCYDGKTISNLNISDICKKLGLTKDKKTTERIRAYVKLNSERLVNGDCIKFYKSSLTGKSLLIFNKGLNIIKSRAELEQYLKDHPSHITVEEKNYRHNLMKKLKRCKSKADFEKRFSPEDIVYMSFDQLYVPIISQLN